MASNPLDDGDQERIKRISDRAYHLWQSEGGKHGHDEEYWERAQELIGMEESAGAGQLPNPMTMPGNDPGQPAIIEESAIQENLGEFPGQADQGEDQPFPTAAATHEAQDAPSPASPPKRRVASPKLPAAAKAPKSVQPPAPVAAKPTSRSPVSGKKA